MSAIMVTAAINPVSLELDDQHSRIKDARKNAEVDVLQACGQNRVERDKEAFISKPYENICALENDEKVTLSNKKCHKVSTSVIIVANDMGPVNCVLDTGVGRDLIRKDVLDKQSVQLMNLKDENI